MSSCSQVSFVHAEEVTQWQFIISKIQYFSSLRFFWHTVIRNLSRFLHLSSHINIKERHFQTCCYYVIMIALASNSERADSTGATGDRLKEGAAINQSLSSLGNVIAGMNNIL